MIAELQERVQRLAPTIRKRAQRCATEESTKAQRDRDRSAVRNLIEDLRGRAARRTADRGANRHHREAQWAAETRAANRYYREVRRAAERAEARWEIEGQRAAERNGEGR